VCELFGEWQQKNPLMHAKPWQSHMVCTQLLAAMHQPTDITNFQSEPFATANREGGPVPGKRNPEN
jgi:hypothetical protein